MRRLAPILLCAILLYGCSKLYRIVADYDDKGLFFEIDDPEAFWPGSICVRSLDVTDSTGDQVWSIVADGHCVRVRYVRYAENPRGFVVDMPPAKLKAGQSYEVAFSGGAGGGSKIFVAR
jgi:hypothetical protein